MPTEISALFEPEDYGNMRIEVESAFWNEQVPSHHSKGYTISLINSATGEPIMGGISRIMPMNAALNEYSEETVRWLLADQISLEEPDVPYEEVLAFINSLELREK